MTLGIRERIAAAVAFSLLPAMAFAQLDAAQIRGAVLDQNGQPIPGVDVEMTFKGETRAPIVKKATTDKKGGYVRVGLKGGPWSLTFRKEGYKTVGMEATLAIGGLNEVQTVTMEPAEKPRPSPPPIAASTVDHAKQLGEQYSKAVAALQAGQSAEAETMFKALVAELPDLAEAHYNLGYLYERRGAMSEAEAEFRRTLELQPQNAAALVALAARIDQRGAEAEALALLEESAPRFADNARVQFALGATAFNLGKNAVAEPAFEKAVALDPANGEALFFLGSIAVARNDVPAAVDRLEKFVAAASPTSPNLETAQALLASLKKKK